VRLLKKLIFIGACSIFLAACNITDKEVTEKVDVEEDVEPAGISKEVENDHFKLVVKSEKQNFALDEPIVVTAELHYLGSEQEMIVYSNATLIDYQLLSDDGNFELSSEGVDTANKFVIPKNQPYIETFEFDKKDESFGSLLDSMAAGSYTMKVEASYEVEGSQDEEDLATEINFEVGGLD
jgi:predicted TPR repeat methyltransferase